MHLTVNSLCSLCPQLRCKPVIHLSVAFCLFSMERISNYFSGSNSVSHTNHFPTLVSCYTPIFCITQKALKFRQFFRFFRKSKRAVLSHFVTLSPMKFVTFCDMEQGRKCAVLCHYFSENLIFPDSAKIPFPYHQLPLTVDFSSVGGHLSISKHRC